MPQSFRPYPEKVEMGTFSPSRFFVDSIMRGGFHFGLLVPHILVPLYLAYIGVKRAGLWTPTTQYFVDNVLVPGLQGLSAGGVIVLIYLRFISRSGRNIANKRDEKAATDAEDLSHTRVQVALWTFIYIGLATFLWQLYPHVDGPGMASLRRTMGRMSIGLDLGGSWRPLKH